MVEYDQYKVSELKDLLRKRNVSPSGTKSELISRLKELDAQEAAEKGDANPEPETKEQEEPKKAEEEPAAEQPTEQPTEQPAAAAENPAAAEPTAAATEESSAKSDKQPKAPVLTDDELLAQVKADLEKQIQRAKRFGSDGTELEARLKRINKFGIAAVRDAAQKVEAKLSNHRRPSRKHGKKFHRGPKPATA